MDNKTQLECLFGFHDWEEVSIEYKLLTMYPMIGLGKRCRKCGKLYLCFNRFGSSNKDLGTELDPNLFQATVE